MIFFDELVVYTPRSVLIDKRPNGGVYKLNLPVRKMLVSRHRYLGNGPPNAATSSDLISVGDHLSLVQLPQIPVRISEIKLHHAVEPGLFVEGDIF